MYPAPAWQAPTLAAYWAAVTAAGTGGVEDRGSPASGYNQAGRGYPDISALALNYVVAVNGNFTAGEFMREKYEICHVY